MGQQKSSLQSNCYMPPPPPHHHHMHHQSRFCMPQPPLQCQPVQRSKRFGCFSSRKQQPQYQCFASCPPPPLPCPPPPPPPQCLFYIPVPPPQPLPIPPPPRPICNKPLLPPPPPPAPQCCVQMVQQCRTVCF